MRSFLRNITARNVLSFGPEGMSLDLQPLNVLIGPNGSGKSNLLEVISLLQAAPRELERPLREGGGVRNWIWQGQQAKPAIVSASVRVSHGSEILNIKHTTEVMEFLQMPFVCSELIETEAPRAEVLYQYDLSDADTPVLKPYGKPDERRLDRKDFDHRESILAQSKNPLDFMELMHLGSFYGQIRLYREWEFGRKAIIRQPMRSDVRPSPLDEDFSNLGMFLNRLRRYPRNKAILFEKLRDFYDGITDFELFFEGGTVGIYFTEGDFLIPASRLSDGSLRYLCLLAILLDPEPPPLIGIEEPEMGLHPDLMHKLADLLVDASGRCQLVVTTHSDALIDALTERPECVVVCEKHDGQTEMRRLDRADLEPWLEKYRLGQLWTAGEFGGVRW